jgi:hypothetical protein
VKEQTDVAIRTLGVCWPLCRAIPQFVRGRN